ncbi:putative rab-like GTPase activating protein [Leptomonas pyrrhocoris]|uniref:Putative rab-like GTPase activating protein n=1 Tax=Leptomonas pyrrhocoris TaxID=157538 RepID=A0A0N0DWF8_LEPPY|nr:putative rab-like GTPase activating protein [Leptomonas pyrrhocoris]XP_015660200.1 putative rab-like GTPase activating protein [Leptomonas pyrrhocoris]KPA81760.1 putative rab-like GTPase activating protein [Leptomonas pyrrhocoris]KPA81761.1 putative rab-like GTPase activating protein [Leptomonas pyrrhocoris]|eukprot:XP_015660199.1 putative rab-like GTPase activating protein [Leptomonas pyrrhocoris]
MIGATKARGNLSIYPHAEEVELRDGEKMAAIFSTTGRRNEALEDAEDEIANDAEQQLPTVASPLRRGGAGLATSQQPNGAQRASNGSVQDGTTHATQRTVRYHCYDMYGFRVTAEEKAAEDFARHHFEHSESDLESWEYIVTHWKSAKVAELKRLCRRGIPQPRRLVVWQRLLRSWGWKQRYLGLYARLRSQEMASKELAGVIERDLDRTFPTHRLFADGVNGRGQQMLRNILRAYANHNPKVGYCQGMGFLAATLILQIEEEEDAFWAFVGLMEGKKYRMAAVFSPGFPELQSAFAVFEGLMKRKMPSLYKHLHDKYQIHPSFYSTHWFMTVFTYYFNFGLISRIWDMFLCEGWKPVYRIALALVHIEERNLLRLRTETELLLALKVIQEAKRPEQLLKVALGIKFKTSVMNRLAAEYQQQTKPK